MLKSVNPKLYLAATGEDGEGEEIEKAGWHISMSVQTVRRTRSLDFFTVQNK